MIPTYLDIPTGRIVVEDFDYCMYALSEGSWSCDCNRSMEFDGLYDELEKRYGEGVCFGSKRIIAIDVSGNLEGRTKEEALAEINQNYWEDV